MKKRKKKNHGTPLSRQKATKGVIRAPWSQIEELPKMQLTSWYHDYLPDFLWLVLLTQKDLRARTFRAFKNVLDVLHRIAPKDSAILLTHQGLKDLSDEQFEELLQPILADPILAKSLRPLGTLTDLPGIDRWRKCLGEPAGDSADAIEQAVSYAAPQDSRAATDIAFLEFTSRIAQGKVSFPPGMIDVDDIQKYVFEPDAVPRISGLVRAMRNAGSTQERLMAGHDGAWVEVFYKWGRLNTECRGFFMSSQDDGEYDKVSQDIIDQIKIIRQKCAEDLTSRFRRIGFNEEREVLSSLGLYACEVAISVGAAGYLSHAQGVVLIRSLAEICILINFISENPDAALRYRSYGAGRAKLIVARSEENGESPHYLFVEELNAVANERRADMFVDMPIGGFYPKSIRDTAIECGCKNIYDSYYDTGSMYAHAEWGGVATSAVQMCGNPLHLGHYIPSQRMFEVDMLMDVKWLILRIGSDLQVSETEGEKQ